MATLSARAGQALRWGTLTLLARIGLQLVAQVLLARLLGPESYGVYALGLALLTFAGFLAGNGFAYGLLLRPHIDDDDSRLAFTWQASAGLACAAAMVVGAPALAAFFRAPDLAPTLQWMAIACLCSACAGTALALMQRALDQRRQGLLQLAAYALGYLGVGLPLALAGWQAQALAAACATQAVATLVLALWLRPHPLRPLWRGQGRAQTLDTGGRVFITNLVNWLAANLDRLIIGRYLQAHAVGLYALAWNLAQVPVTLLVGAAQPALLAAGTQLRGRGARTATPATAGASTALPPLNPQALRRLAGAWEMAMASAATLLPGAALCLAMLAPDLVILLYGPAWQDSGALLAVMLLCLPAWTAWALATPVLWHAGRSHLEAGLQLPLLALALPLWIVTALFGERVFGGSLLPVALLSALLLHARAWRTVRAALVCLGRPVARLAPATGRGLLLAGACALALQAGRELAQALAPSLLPAAWVDAPSVFAALRLFGGGAAALAAAGGLLAWRPTLLGPQALALLRRTRVAEGRS
jgi:O-antigen/teichoic acid export membrane protein